MPKYVTSMGCTFAHCVVQMPIAYTIQTQTNKNTNVQKNISIESMEKDYAK